MFDDELDVHAAMATGDDAVRAREEADEARSWVELQRHSGPAPLEEWITWLDAHPRAVEAMERRGDYRESCGVPRQSKKTLRGLRRAVVLCARRKFEAARALLAAMLEAGVDVEEVADPDALEVLEERERERRARDPVVLVLTDAVSRHAPPARAFNRSSRREALAA